MKIASMENLRPRGTVIGRQVSGPLLSEAEHFKRCPLCHGFMDMRDLVWCEEHQQPLPHPPGDRA